VTILELRLIRCLGKEPEVYIFEFKVCNLFILSQSPQHHAKEISDSVTHYLANLKANYTSRNLSTLRTLHTHIPTRSIRTLSLSPRLVIPPFILPPPIHTLCPPSPNSKPNKQTRPTNPTHIPNPLSRPLHYFFLQLLVIVFYFLCTSAQASVRNLRLVG